MLFVKVESGVEIAVYDLNPAGEHAVFFVHGWPVNHRMFEYQFDVLPKHGYRCISMDLRGFGNSDAPWSGYGYDRLADDVFEVIRAMRVRDMTLVGFSMGGPVAIRYMSRHKGYRIKRLALLSAAAPSFIQREGYPYGMTAAQVDAFISQAYQDRPQMVTDFGKMFFASDITQSFTTWFNSLGFDAAGHSTIKTLVSLRDETLFGDLPKIHVPTGIFHGALDKICPFPFAIEMNKGIPDSKIYRFEHSGHGVFYDELEKFNREFLAFLNA